MNVAVSLVTICTEIRRDAYLGRVECGRLGSIGGARDRARGASELALNWTLAELLHSDKHRIVLNEEVQVAQMPPSRSMCHMATIVPAFYPYGRSLVAYTVVIVSF